MSSHGLLAYFAFGTILFFFWVYGIVSFVSDLRRQVIPWVRARRRERRDENPDEPATDRLEELHGEPDDE
jgi:cytochrome c-type biogenesis protein CcmH/NrfG